MPAADAARIEIDSCALRFETCCGPALRQVEDMLARTLTGGYYTYAVGPVPPGERLPTLRYVDGPEYGADWDPETDVCTFSAPWREIGDTLVLAMWLYYLSELVRQRRAEYLLHASAVVREGRAIVIVGPSHAGKTICALELCLAHGFQLFANNRVKAAVRGSRPRLLRGDGVLNLRFSSLRRYDGKLAERIFADPDPEQAPTQRKRRVEPEALGIQTASPAPEIAALVFVALEADAPGAVVERLPAEIACDAAFRAVDGLYQEMSGLIRGTRFVPFAFHPGARPFFVPSLDCPEFVSARVAFLEALFACGAVLRIRAPLERAVVEMLSAFD